MLPLICILAWATVCLLVVGVAMRGERAIIRERIGSLKLSYSEDVEKVLPELSLPFGERVLRPFLRSIAATLARLLPAGTQTLAKKLEQAGNPGKIQPVEFMGLKVLSILIFIGLGVLFCLMIEAALVHKVVALVCAFIIGYAIPDSMLEGAIRERHRIIRRSMPNSLDLLVVSAEAGLGFDAAISKVVERTEGPLATEFSKVLQDMSLGRSRTDALRAMSDRVGLPELTSFVAAIRQADMFGTSVVGVLRAQAASLRLQRNLRAREMAAKLPVKMLFPLVFCIFPAIFAVLLAPGVMQIAKALATTGR